MRDSFVFYNYFYILHWLSKVSILYLGLIILDIIMACYLLFVAHYKKISYKVIIQLLHKKARVTFSRVKISLGNKTSLCNSFPTDKKTIYSASDCEILLFIRLSKWWLPEPRLDEKQYIHLHWESLGSKLRQKTIHCNDWWCSVSGYLLSIFFEWQTKHLLFVMFSLMFLLLNLLGSHLNPLLTSFDCV